MYCKNCGKLNDKDSKFCVYCGQGLAQPPAADTYNSPTPTINIPVQNPGQQSLFTTQFVDLKKNTSDKGYMIIAILAFVNLIVWFGFSLFADSGTNMSFRQIQDLYKIVKVTEIILIISQFAVMLIYAKKEGYKIIIGIAGLLATVGTIYLLIQELKRW